MRERNHLVSYSLDTGILRPHRGWTTRVPKAGPPSPKRSVAMVTSKITAVLSLKHSTETNSNSVIVFGSMLSSHTRPLLSHGSTLVYM